MKKNKTVFLDEVTAFLKRSLKRSGKENIAVAVSGGIDSAVSLTLAVRAVGAANVFPILLPYEDQSMSDAERCISWNKIEPDQSKTINILPLVQAATEVLGLALEADQLSLRLGNIMARSRMIVLYDWARQHNALVCGTENKSEKHLGYFTRFGDEASDIEPLLGLYKTEVRELAAELQLPKIFLEKAPSAGLWKGQTDEEELGFSYAEADPVLRQLIDEKGSRRYLQLIEGSRVTEVTRELAEDLPDLAEKTIEAVLKRVQSQQFKQEVPYELY